MSVSRNERDKEPKQNVRADLTDEILPCFKSTAFLYIEKEILSVAQYINADHQSQKRWYRVTQRNIREICKRFMETFSESEILKAHRRIRKEKHHSDDRSPEHQTSCIRLECGFENAESHLLITFLYKFVEFAYLITIYHFCGRGIASLNVTDGFIKYVVAVFVNINKVILLTVVIPYPGIIFTH